MLGREAAVAKLGPDPLHDQDVQSGAERAWQRITKSRKTIAELLLDQSVVAGVGNVYRFEVLFRHRVDPFTLGSDLGRPLWLVLWNDLVAQRFPERLARDFPLWTRNTGGSFWLRKRG